MSNLSLEFRIWQNTVDFFGGVLNGIIWHSKGANAEVGEEVEVRGLMRAAHLNGRVGRVQGVQGGAGEERVQVPASQP